jgi:threonine dehydratase
MATARAGALAGVPVTVYVAKGSSPSKLAAIEALGAKLVVVDGAPIDAELAARRTAEAEGRTYVSPYNDLQVVAGQGTLGLELAERAPDLDAVFISVGGGGLIGGAGTALKAFAPNVRVVGVWPEHSPCMLRALEAGRIVPTQEQPTLSDATAGAIEDGSVTFRLCQAAIDERITVTEPEIARAMRRVAASDGWMVEGAAGVALAGLIQRADAWQGRKVAVVLCGRNVGLETYLAALAAQET